MMPSLSRQPNVWIAGDTDDADFAPIVGWLRGVSQCEFVVLSAPSPDRAVTPEVIVLLQTRPGSIRQFDVERLHCLAPLARLMVVAGPWCEGELRSGRPIQGVTRILWHQWKLRLPLELGISLHIRCGIASANIDVRRSPTAIARGSRSLAAAPRAGRGVYDATPPVRNAGRSLLRSRIATTS